MTLEGNGSVAELRQLAERMRSQIDSAHAEIGETRAILRDAIERLIPAFTRQQSDTAEVRLAVHEAAFSALQFQDISDQQLAHAQVRLVALRTQLDLFHAALTEGSQAAGVGRQLLSLVASANEHLAKLDITLVKPVAKPHLGSGDMELF